MITLNIANGGWPGERCLTVSRLNVNRIHLDSWWQWLVICVLRELTRPTRISSTNPKAVLLTLYDRHGEWRIHTSVDLLLVVLKSVTRNLIQILASLGAPRNSNCCWALRIVDNWLSHWGWRSNYTNVLVNFISCRSEANYICSWDSDNNSWTCNQVVWTSRKLTHFDAAGRVSTAWAASVPHEVSWSSFDVNCVFGDRSSVVVGFVPSHSEWALVKGHCESSYHSWHCLLVNANRIWKLTLATLTYWFDFVTSFTSINGSRDLILSLWAVEAWWTISIVVMSMSWLRIERSLGHRRESALGLELAVIQLVAWGSDVVDKDIILVSDWPVNSVAQNAFRTGIAVPTEAVSEVG